MIIRRTEFITSAASEKGFIKPDRPLIAVCGKSNVGKSSFINALANNGKLARTSNTPGRTRLVNYFDFGEFILADLPGYGFAKVSREEKLKWAALLEAFFSRSQDISHVFSLMDIRHDPTEDDKSLIAYLYHYRIPFVVVATKADKLPKTKIKPQLQRIATELKIGIGDITASSAETGLGREDILALIEKAINIQE